MYAVFSTGGKQYRARTGDIIKVEKLEAEKGSTVELDNVLMVGEGEDVKVGTPYLKGGRVTAKVVEHGRGEKIKIIKFIVLFCFGDQRLDRILNICKKIRKIVM